jgi:4-diphosphocytidyl-2-C-methyl-D-erythritol kinase
MLAHRSATDIEVHAPAKLNLFFEVLSKRQDGYHEIETLMAPVSLFDTLYLSAISPCATDTRGPMRFSCELSAGLCDGANPASIPTGSENIVVAALELLRERSGTDLGAEVRLVKRIPPQAGLGGGSSDAAAALLAANTAWKLNWPAERLAQLGGELGSDVPFFFAGGPAVCRGRGELVEPVCGLGDVYAVVVHPPEGLSTAAVYGACRVPQQHRHAHELMDAMRCGRPAEFARCSFNRLESTALELSPWIERLKAEFEKLDCVAHQMTGSGTAYFGICHHARHANRIAGMLRSRSVGRVYAVRSAS